ncbi:uncharacterized protein [Primulina huaijiensis]|uniref:uncharacterized protein isoform X4 n=1 Tax=Primulina huaijiensis TaxID=1492673 RepID=UPI003CC70D63
MVEAAEVNVIIAVSLGIWLGIASTESVAGMIAVVITAGGMGIWRGSVQVLAVADVEIVELVLPVVSRGIWRGTVRVVEAIVVVVVVVLGGLEAEAAGSAEGSASTAGSLDILLGNARNRLADDLCMAFPHSHSPHSGWDKFHGLTKINTRAQLHSINIQRHPGIKVLGARRFLCGLFGVHVTGHSELGNLVISMVFHGFFWCYQVCIGSIRDGNWIVHHLRMERIVDAYFTSNVISVITVHPNVRVCPSQLGFLFMLFQLRFHGEL